jgi:hypothetical protein
MDWDRRRVLGVLGTSATVGLSSCLHFGDSDRFVVGSGAGSVQSLTVGSQPATTSALTARLPDGQSTRLTASDSHRANKFGHGVALSGTGSTALVSVPGGDSDAVEVFVRRHGAWRRQRRLHPADEHRDSGFGRGLTLSADGSTALVGAPGRETTHGDSAGAVYVFVRPQFVGTRRDDWQRQPTLVPETGAAGDAFGTTVALASDGKTALIGTNGHGARSADVFSASGGYWTQRHRLTAPGERSRQLGRSVALSDDGSTALLSARGHALGYVFTLTGTNWDWTATLSGTVTDGSDADRPVALSDDGSVALVATPQARVDGALSRGAIHVFVRRRDDWKREGPLVLPDGESLDRLGSSVAVGAEGRVVLAGAPGESDPNGTNAGAVYAFVRHRNGWSRHQKFVAADGGGLDRFSPVALSANGSTALVGAPGASPAGLRRRGAAYVFE